MSYIPQTGTVPPPSAQGVSGSLPGQQAVNTTKILSLTGFSKELKTRDIQSIFVDYEDDRGGYRIKWLDDTGCLIVFNDAITAKKAFLHLLANPHDHLRPSFDPENPSAPSATVPVLAPYVEEDSSTIIAGVSNRPRSRSIASNNNPSSATTPSHHGRRMSNTSGNHQSLINGGSGGGSPGPNSSSQHDLGRKTSRTFSRPSAGQAQMPAILDDPNASSSNDNNDRPSSPSSPTSNGGAIDWNRYQQQQRSRAASGSSSIPGGNTFSPPTSPDKGMGGVRAGAHSPTAFRRLVAQRQ